MALPFGENSIELLTEGVGLRGGLDEQEHGLLDVAHQLKQNY